MRAIMCCVDYSDILALTLPYNRHHFESVWVVTSGADHATQEVAIAHGADLVVTDMFYKGGADFNKWAALEHGLDVMGRRGWLCVMDADVLWPRAVRTWEAINDQACLLIENGTASQVIRPGTICSPLRRMWNDFPRFPDGCQRMTTDVLPMEEDWCKPWFPIHRNTAEWAGYSQIFHADDPVLGPPPWHEVDWKHAGGADSFFQDKWAPKNKVRPPFEVLHLGPAGLNWMGRATPRLDGTLPPDWEERQRKCVGIWQGRRKLRAEGRDPFGPEKIG